MKRKCFMIIVVALTVSFLMGTPFCYSAESIKIAGILTADEISLLIQRYYLLSHVV